MFLEGVGDVFEEDDAEDDVLVFRRVHVVAQLVSGEPELGLEADGGGGLGGAGGVSAGHEVVDQGLVKRGGNQGISNAELTGFRTSLLRPRAAFRAQRCQCPFRIGRSRS